MAQLELQDVSFTYPGAERPVINKLSLTINTGEAHALLGASGAGKTTLLNLLSGLLAPTSGRIRFDDRDVSMLRGRARKVAQVFQFPVLYESLRVYDNIAFPLRQLKLSAADIKQRVAYIAEELEIEPLLQQRPVQLSLFEKQLVAVAKALVRPDISVVLLDEPLTAVEPRIKWRLRQALRRVKRDLGVTMVYVTHDQTEALTFAEQVSVLTQDGILQTDSPEDIYQSPQHQFVGHFIGSPGMNFVPAHVLDGLYDLQNTAADTIGFRPEWIQPDPMGAISGEVQHVKAEGARGGVRFGLIRILVGEYSLLVRGPLEKMVGERFSFGLSRAIQFAAGHQVGVYEPTV